MEQGGLGGRKSVKDEEVKWQEAKLGVVFIVCIFICELCICRDVPR